MPLFAVERDLSQIPPERFRTELKGLVGACARLKGNGKRVRYISSAVFPAEARGLCLFGAEQPQWVHEVNQAAGLPYSRIFAVLDLTPTGVRRDLSCGRRPAEEPTVGARARGSVPGSPGPVSEEITRWSDEGRQLLQTLGGWLEAAGSIHAGAEALELDRAVLADELRRLEEDNEALRAQRDELHDAVQTIASQMTRAADELLYRFGPQRGAPSDLAPR
ncbi:MAG TPA: nickel-binding protein [Methylomirabilota bacterium]